MSLQSLISSLTPEEKWTALELLWSDLAGDDCEAASPDWHRDELQKRRDDPRPEPRLTLDEARREVEQALHARRIGD